MKITKKTQTQIRRARGSKRRESANVVRTLFGTLFKKRSRTPPRTFFGRCSDEVLEQRFLRSLRCSTLSFRSAFRKKTLFNVVRLFYIVFSIGYCTIVALVEYFAYTLSQVIFERVVAGAPENNKYRGLSPDKKQEISLSGER